MKKAIIGVLTSCCLIFMGCNLTGNVLTNNDSESGSQTTFTALDTFAFDFPDGWKLSEVENPYDLHCYSKKEDIVTGVFIYEKSDLAENITVEDILELQIDDLRSKRDNFKFIEDIKDTNINGKRIKTAVYSGEKDGEAMVNYYIFSIVDFNDYDKFAYIIQICFPSDWNKYKSIMEKIVSSCRPVN